jgi:hypothetical protein
MLAKASCCKVNLLLNILGKRPDGFHELETVLHPVDVCDRLEFERAGSGIHLTCNDSRLPVNAKNLVFRAAALFSQTAGVNDGLRIHLHKQIPIAAGLGGGSGNAAVTLLALNELFGARKAWGIGGIARLGYSLFSAKQARFGDWPGRNHHTAGVFPGLAGNLPGFGASGLWRIDPVGLRTIGQVSSRSQRRNRQGATFDFPPPN